MSHTACCGLLATEREYCCSKIAHKGLTDFISDGSLRYLTAVVDGNVSGWVLHKGRFVAVVGWGGGAEGVAEKVDGVALELASRRRTRRLRGVEAGG